MKRTYIWNTESNQFVERVRAVNQSPYVQSDISEHGGRRAWRDKLKANGSIEVSPAEMQAASEKFRQRKADFQERVNRGKKLDVAPVDAPVMESRPYEMSRLNREIANRLDGRPAPDRKMLIKMTLDMQRSLNRR